MKSIQQQSESKIPTRWGEFQMIAFSSEADDYSPHLALLSKKFKADETVLVRVHSECLTGDIFGSKRCDCGEQLHHSLEKLSQTNGVLIYLRQEGRGIGLINKLRAYNLQDQGLNTQDANIHLGFEPDERSYEVAVKILLALGVKKIKLLTNNPEKLDSIQQSRITLEARVP
jgi:3,4-dihydroxy 2-butanone 4-phosphate synthase/GTP cyclohydrolase II